MSDHAVEFSIGLSLLLKYIDGTMTKSARGVIRTSGRCYVSDSIINIASISIEILQGGGVRHFGDFSHYSLVSFISIKKLAVLPASMEKRHIVAFFLVVRTFLVLTYAAYRLGRQRPGSGRPKPRFYIFS